VSRGVVVSTGIPSDRLPFHQQGSQSLSSSGSAQESDNLSEPPIIEQKFRPPPAPSLVSPRLPVVSGNHRLLITPPDIVERALEESKVPRAKLLSNGVPDRPPSLLVDLEEVISRLEGGPSPATENLNPPPDPPWGDHGEADPREPPDIGGDQCRPRWSRN
jgi:hypothetical protein